MLVILLDSATTLNFVPAGSFGACAFVVNAAAMIAATMIVFFM
jgi:hypothetical protein